MSLDKLILNLYRNFKKWPRIGRKILKKKKGLKFTDAMINIKLQELQ